MKVFAIVDCNSFYCSCERLFRPDLRNRPVGVLSNNDGCFVSRSTELKLLGVKVGTPYFKVKDICEKNDVTIFSSNFSLYTNISDRIMQLLSTYSSEIEIYSVDEAFLNLSWLDEDSAISYCRKIKKDIMMKIGIPVSIGIAGTKTLAKVASGIAKKDKKYGGVTSLLSKLQQDVLLKHYKINDVWGIGRKTSDKLRFLKIKTAREFRDYQNDYLIQKIFTKTGRVVQEELRGISCLDIENEVKKKKEILSSRTFGKPIYDINNLKESVAKFATSSCEKLRKQNSVCSIIEVCIRTNPNKDTIQYFGANSFRMISHTDDLRIIIKFAWDILDRIYKSGIEYNKALVKISGIVDSNQSQISMFDSCNLEKTKQLMNVVDAINRREGPGSIKSAACISGDRSWSMKQNFKSPRYLSGWTQLCKVN